MLTGYCSSDAQAQNYTRLMTKAKLSATTRVNKNYAVIFSVYSLICSQKPKTKKSKIL